MFNPNDPYSQPPQDNPYDASNQYNPNYSNSQDPRSGFTGANTPYPRTQRRRQSGCLGCLLSLGIFGGLLFLLAQFSDIWSSSPAFYVQGDNPFAVSQLWITGAIVWIIGALVLFIFRALRLISGKRERPIRSLAATFLGLTIFAFFIVLLIWGSVFNPNIGMTRTSFMRTTVSIDNGTTVHFHNPADGVTQILCVGVNQRCRAGDSDPSQLDRGLVIQPGQTVNVAFYADGTYQITSKTTPNMNLTIDVTTPDNSGGD
ncbi:MAG TPA: hypothetical protein VGM01_12840 [Ktedonobacteraceae bacterium]